ncbi:MAG: ferrous iron transport protein B [Nitrospinae bacterium]|nr:ferrous iron transport protein B [Nitrospinota bacterium]
MNAPNRKIAIIGPPNVGKSTLFNKFSRAYSVVSNYAQTTIESLRKESRFAGGVYEIIDTPGLFSLASASEDEAVSCRILMEERPRIVLFCGDATNLKRSLILLSQVLELGLPTVLCLNKVDEAGRRGISINAEAIAEILRIPAVLTAAIHGVGLAEVEKAAHNAGTPVALMTFAPHIEKAALAIQGIFRAENGPARGELLLLLAEDPVAETVLRARYGDAPVSAAIEERTKLFRVHPSAGIRHAIFSARESWADGVVAKVAQKKALDVRSLGYEAARLAREPLTGVPILIGVLWLTFYAVGNFSTKLAAVLDTWVFIPFSAWVSGIIPNLLLKDFLVGNYGILTMGVINAIGTVVPILLVFFLIINFLEEIGYLPNLSVLANRMMKPMGLSGKAVLPMVLGFGCNTMATVATRMLETRKERIIASFLIALGFPCAVQLGILLAILSTSPFSALLVVVGTVIITQVVVGLALGKIIPTERTADFIVELPTFSAPNWRNISVKTYFRIKWFLVEVLPLFIAASLLMFALDKSGLLATIDRLARPVVTGLLSLPESAAEVFILVLARREIGAVFFKNMVDGGLLDYYQTVTGLVVITLFIPCASNTMVMIKELGARWAIGINLTIIALAIGVGTVVNFTLRLF